MGVENVSIRDLNIETMDILLSSEKVKKTHAAIEERLNKGTGAISSENPEEVYLRLSWAKEVIERE
ncbi:MAG TPA: hypothetical protein QF423_00090, partial [Candidatus Scalindua sp.]|nr:hypothetical protein [Candidatus Scalindua sp.]